MEGIVSSMDSFELLRILSFTPRAEFPRETYVHMALFYSALALCFWGFVVAWWRKCAQSEFVLCLSPCRSFKLNAARHQIPISRVPAMMFALDRVSHVNNPTTSLPAEENERGSRGKFHMRFECSIQSPEELPADDFSQNREASVADSCKNCVTSFCSSSDKQILGFENFRIYEEACLERPKRNLQELLLLSEEIVKCFDVSHSRDLLATSTVDRNNTVRVWDISARKSLNYMKFDDASVIARVRFSESPHLLSVIGVAEEKSSLYVWDTRNFLRPLSLSMGKNSRLDIVEFNEKKVYVCDDLSERVFDLRMGGEPVLEAGLCKCSREGSINSIRCKGQRNRAAIEEQL